MDTTIADIELDANARSAAVARRFVSDTLAGWGCEQAMDTLKFLANELVTNAILHAGGKLTVRLWRTPTRLRCEVCDENPGAPAIRPYAVDDLTGRGLALVVATATAWGIEPHGHGKCVWFEMEV